MPLFKKVRLAERYDLAIMSTKGLSVTASRHLVDQFCGIHKIPLLVLHDFDKAGFSILGTLQRDTRRYEFEHNIEVVDLGLRLEDITKYSLPSEKVSYGKSDPTSNLRENGATDAEMNYLCDRRDWNRYSGQRVELNAFASQELVDWIESKLKKHKIKKLVPDDGTLALAYRRSLEAQTLNARLEEIAEEVEKEIEGAKIPRGLATKIKKHLKEHPSDPWDKAITAIASYGLDV